MNKAELEAIVASQLFQDIQSDDIHVKNQALAKIFMAAQSKILPNILAERASATQSLVGIAMQGLYEFTGVVAGIDQISDTVCLLLCLWKEGLFVPTLNYPHTLDATVQAFSKEATR